MRKSSLIAVLFVLMAFTSCVKTEYHYVDDSLKVWFVDRDKADFQVRDQNGITQQFQVFDTVVGMVPGESYFLFVKTDEDLCENINQNGNVSFYQGQALSLSVTNYYGTGHSFSLCFYDVNYAVEVEDGFTCTRAFDNKDYAGRNIPCTLEMLDSYEVNGKVYSDVMHFKITDWDAISTRNTFPSELYYAKHYGPIEYELGGTITVKRL